MQTIENSLLQVSVDENGARLTNLANQHDKFDYLKNSEKQENMAVAFPAIDQEKNWALKLPWTVVDKGDSRVSLTLIDTEESYHSFPFHFEVVLTYALEGNQVIVSFYLKNNSHKEMPFSLGLIIPILAGWQVDNGLNQLILSGVNNHELKIASTDFKLSNSEKTITALTDELSLGGDSSQNFELVLTLS
ncbi:aldose epimerase family protein [Lactobacillus sp. PSON]|uniref:aldose epimerase family protein n=1 Tax=Lactobacillus sp. PSON TaxID=3455454 RepID=UPI0040425D3E